MKWCWVWCGGVGGWCEVGWSGSGTSAACLARCHVTLTCPHPLPPCFPLPCPCVSRRDQLSKLAAHVEIASRLNTLIDEHALTDLGKLEQVRVWCVVRVWMCVSVVVCVW